MNEQRKSRPLRIAVLDDHPLIRKALEYSLMTEEGMSLAGLFKNRQEIMPLLNDNGVDVLVLDYLLGDEEMDGLKLIRYLNLHFPHLKIIMSSAVESAAIVQLAIRAGAHGFVGKSEEHQLLLDGIRTVGSGKKYITPEMQLRLDKFHATDKEMQDYVEPREKGQDVQVRIRTLSPREIEVILCYLEGMTIMQIAAKFSRSRKTISGQKQKALSKLGLESDLDLYKFRDEFDLLK
jgi:DNA-binding NarL/FixJ family response regulator